MTRNLSDPSARQRWWLWLPLLGLGGWLALVGDRTPPGDRQAISAPTRSNTPAPVAGAPAPSEGLLPLVLREDLIAKPEPPAEPPSAAPVPAQRDLFAVRNWTPPPPPPPPPPPAPPPVAPPLPFVFLGKKLEASAWEVYLGRGEQTVMVREGQVLEGSYRVDSIQPPTMQLTYLPFNQTQSLQIGQAQ